MIVDDPAARRIDQDRIGLHQRHSAAPPMSPRVSAVSGTCSESTSASRRRSVEADATRRQRPIARLIGRRAPDHDRSRRSRRREQAQGHRLANAAEAEVADGAPRQLARKRRQRVDGEAPVGAAPRSACGSNLHAASMSRIVCSATPIGRALRGSWPGELATRQRVRARRRYLASRRPDAGRVRDSLPRRSAACAADRSRRWPRRRRRAFPSLSVGIGIERE